MKYRAMGKGLVGVLIFGCLAMGNFAWGARFNTVIIDAGHGGKDKGTMWGGVRESRLSLNVANDLEALLRKRGIRTVMTRRSDVFVSLNSRAAIANRYRSAVFVSIHFNAALNTNLKGAQAFYWSNSGRILASAIHRRMVPRLKVRDLGVRRYGYTVLVKTHCPAVLIESGFLSNTAERNRCNTRWYQQTVARSIYDGLMAYR